LQDAWRKTINVPTIPVGIISKLKDNIRDLGIDGMVLTLKTIGLEAMN